MTDEENTSVEAEVAEPSNQEQEHNDVSERPSQTQNQKRNDAEHNWAEMRRQREKDRQELDNLRAELNQIKKPSAPEEEDFGVKDDDLLEGRHLKDLKKEIKQLKSDLRQKEVTTMQDRLQMKFPDYSDVVSEENIELLKQTEPELAQSLYHMPDPYSQAVAAYKLLKKISGPKDNSNALERKKVAENSQKPVSVNTVTKNSAIGNAHMFENGLTPELKAQLYKEMQTARKAG